MRTSLIALHPWSTAAVIAGLPTGAIAAGALVGGVTLPFALVFLGVALLFAAIAVFVQLRQGPLFPRGLPFAGRRTVAESVLKGQPVTDPALAPAVIHYAAKVRSTPRSLRAIWAALAVIQGLRASVAFAEGDVGDALPALVVLILAGTLFVTHPRQVQVSNSRADAAEAAARRLLAQG